MSDIDKRILITGARAPCALHLARCLAVAGHQVWLADSLAFPLARATKMAAGYVRLPSPRGQLAAYGAAVKSACEQHRIDLVLPTCEEVFHLAAVRDLLDLDLPLLAPDFALLKKAHDKFTFTQMAQGFGADPAETHLLLSAADVGRFQGKGWAFKPVWSRFGDRVLVEPDATTLSALRPTAADPWIAQAYLPGEELCAYAAARDGNVCALQAYRPLYRAGNGIGAGVMVEPVEDIAITQFVGGFVRSTCWTGQVSFDFRRDADGGLHVLECNPRATTGAHFFALTDGLARALIDGQPATASGKRRLGNGLAMLIYGLPQGHFAQWWRDFRTMDSLLENPVDRATAPWQALAVAEAVWRAVAQGQGLKAAATSDIEWNGEAF